MARLPLKQQAYLSAALVLSLRALGKNSALQAPGLQRALLEGISTRLDNALEPIRSAGANTTALPTSREDFSCHTDQDTLSR